MKGKICIITGASSGLGKAAALQLADMGAIVIAVCRNQQQIRSDIETFVADLSSQGAIRRLAQALLKKYPNIDVLIHNAGVLLPRREITIDGLEETFAVNHLAPFLLTKLLLPSLQATPSSRVIIVTSRAEELGEIDFKDLQAQNSYHWMTAYAQSKLANLLFAYELTRQLRGAQVAVHCLHPGLIHSRLGRQFNSRILLPILLRPFMQKASQAAKALVRLAVDPALAEVTGKYFIKYREAKSSSRSYDVQLAKNLWEHSESLTQERVSCD